MYLLLGHRAVVSGGRSLCRLTKQHRQLVQSMMRLLDIDALDLSKHPYTNYVSIDTHSLGLTALVAITLNPLPSRKV